VNGRGQSTVVGVALLVGITMVALGAMTASVGTVVESQADRADAAQVARSFEDLRPAATTGAAVVDVAFASGRMKRVERDLRVRQDGSVIAHRTVNALVYGTASHRAVFLGGAVLRRNGESTWFTRPPPVTATDGRNRTLVVGTTVVEGDPAASGDFDGRFAVEVHHTRRSLGNDSVSVAVETAAPRPWEDYFEQEGATVTRVDIDGDGTRSVVAEFGTRETHLVVHRMEVDLDG